MECLRTVQPRLQMSASTSQDPVITASGARKGSGHRILGEGPPERKAEPKSISFTLQLSDSMGEKSSVDGSTRYCGKWLPPRISEVIGGSMERSMSSADFFEIVGSTSTMLPGRRSIACTLSKLDDRRGRAKADLHELYPCDARMQSPAQPASRPPMPQPPAGG